MVKQIYSIVGDSQKDNHRAALAGNAMQFTTSRWVQLTAGADALPLIGPQSTFTIIVSGRVTGLYSIDNIFGGILNTANHDIINFLSVFSNGIRFFGWDSGIILDVYGNSGMQRRYLDLKESPIRRVIYGGVYEGTSPSVASLFSNSRKSVIAATGTTDSANAINPIGVMRINNLAAGTVGDLRSLEVIFRKLTDAELRQAFNLGTAYAAGFITTADISIDFNRINGQLPICRTGSRQLTVTAYNNTTPDTAGTTYVPF